MVLLKYTIKISRLAIEIYKVINNEECATGFKDLFCVRDSYSNRSFSELMVPSVNSVLNGQNSIRYIGPLLWNSIPIELRNISTLAAFKNKIKKWKPEGCSCRLCKTS